MSSFLQDLRYALRGLRLKPGFAIAVVLTLALGIGANATMFGIVDRLLFRPPAFLIDPARGARIYTVTTFRGKENPGSYFGYRRYLDFRENTTSFDAWVPWTYSMMAVGQGDATREMRIETVGADLWKVFDVKPVIGRFFTSGEDQAPDGTMVAVLSYGLWQTEFGGRRSVLGETLDIGSGRYTIIGVAPAGFNGFDTDPAAGFIPITAAAAVNNRGNKLTNGLNQPTMWYDSYNMSWFQIYARRNAAAAPAKADADLSNAFQLSYRKQKAVNPRAQPIEIARPHAYAGPLLADRGPQASKESKVATWLVGVALIVLLIACANVANLLVSRALKRRREVALRVALGVSRARLLGQLLTESAVLAVMGGLAGLAIAQSGGVAIRSLLIEHVATSTWTDGRVLFFAGALTLLAGVATGLAPAVHAWRTDVAAALKAGSREGTVQRSRLRVGLLVMQAALSVVLLVGAGLFLRSLSNVKNARLGFDVDPVLWVNLKMRGVKLDSTQMIALQRRLLERTQNLPGVEHASRALTVPFWSTWEFSLFVSGIDSVTKLGSFTIQAATPDFFATLGTRILKGRGITPEDRAGSPFVMVVGQGMAQKLWPGDDPIGKCIRLNADTAPCRTVVGVAEDVRRNSLSEAENHYYMPIEQFQPQQGGLFVRVNGEGADKAEGIRRALQPLMPGVSYVIVTPMTDIVGPQMRSWKLGATMFAIFGGLALVLAAIGLYSVIAYNVAQRTHEMGVRVALGAQTRDVVSLVVSEGLRVVVPGVALGAGVALVGAKWVKPLLFEESPRDPTVMVGVILALLATALLASWLPARRAAGVDPGEALRAD